ncbi:MAG: J domain-containing protein [Pseudomonadota bacterium]
MRDQFDTAFKHLHLEPNTDRDRIRRAYKRRVQQLHPDRAGENSSPQKQQEFQDVLNAYKLLDDALKSGKLSVTHAETPEAGSRSSPPPTPPEGPAVSQPENRRPAASETFYQTSKPASALKFISVVVSVVGLFVFTLLAIAAWQKANTTPRQWDANVHEQRAQGSDSANRP